MKLNKILFLTSLASSYLFSTTIGLNLGKANISYSQTNSDGSIVLGNEPDEDFNSYEIYTTLDKKVFKLSPYLSYSYNKNDELKHQYILVGLNKEYTIKKFNLYAGLVGGYGELTWKYNPLSSSTSNNPSADGLMGGIQVGITYPLSSKFALGLDAKYLKYNYETKLRSSSTSAVIEHDKTTAVSFNLNYSF